MVTEKEIKIKTPDKFTIYGTLVGGAKKSEKLVIFVHGFTGHRNEHIFFNGAKFFAEKGIDSFRFDLYTGEKKARHFRKTKISLHGEDITTVVGHFKKQYKKIYVVGHSFGGTSLLFTDSTLVNGLIFWDASWIDQDKEKRLWPYNKSLDAHILDWGIEYVVGKGFQAELKNFPDCGELIRKIHKPTIFITAGSDRAKGANAKAGKRYFAKANKPKSLVNIPTADHNFNTFADEGRLLEETYKFIKKY